MPAPALETTVLAPARGKRFAEPRPAVRTVVRHVALNLIVATAVPTALFYTCLVIAGMWAALIAADMWVALVAALTWCYVTMVWRIRTGRPTSGLLWLTVAGLTGRTVLALATGSTFIYFVQPAIGDAAVAAAFLISLATARPAVARLAAEFFPMTSDVAARPRVQLLFTRLTLLWAGICAAKAGVTLWLLHTLSMTTFVAARMVYTPSVAVLGAAVTVLLAMRVARREGLLAGSRLAT